MNRRILVIIGILAILIVGAGIYAYSSPTQPDTKRLIVSTTTSLEDTGLLKEIETAFEDKYPGVDVSVISGGTGIALQYGERGDADVLLTHDKNREEEFIESGFGTNRTEIAYNYFWIVGPENDPAGIRGLNATEAFSKIMEEGQNNPDKVKFASRGDDSGTHAREKQIWGRTGVSYEEVSGSGAWYIESGRGMGETLLLASEQNAYTLTDSGTFLAYTNEGRIRIVPLVTTGDELLNVYAAMPVNPERHPNINYEGAQNFVNFLVSPDGQEIIQNFGREEYGQPLFIPISQGLPS
ncbi:MAG: substrate-binding domain-containing protein [Methanosarcina flavescens]|jgi:tungstate transport system substrate-binding protein|uniref:Solute-binding protein n=1 Tax=Methanosarcina flavescens TaxID=1715806 RepID=A0A660HVR9_9EURY|nr:substrate-binding domain-containing protein [Methanosarcina flavescens]AYK15955.1 tungsten ABC transporter substrate-binding protein [Methanosarcina flavescens]NLK33239.1 solute-binding protein [Methanosarcina flavescens]